jgi:hypothetical protein
VLLLELALGWAGACATLVLSGTLACIRKTRPIAKFLLVPAGLLLSRKALLYVPLPGAVWSEDQILFWSIGSAAYAVLIPASITLLIYLLSDGASDDEINGGFWGTYACCVIVSVLIVPVDGPSHFVFPFLYALGALKLVIASPLTLPVAVCAFVICLGFLYLRRTECMLGVSALALVLAGCGGIVQLSYQFKYVHQLRAAIGMTEALDFPDFLSTAAGHLDDIQRCGAGSIETAGRSMSATCDVRAALNSVPSVWTLAGTRAGLLAFVLAGLVWPITGKAQEVCSNISVWWYREKA